MVGDSGIIYLSSRHEPTKTRPAVYDKVRIKHNLMKPISGRNSTIKNHSANHNLLYSSNSAQSWANGIRGVFLPFSWESGKVSDKSQCQTTLVEAMIDTISLQNPAPTSPNEGPHSAPSKSTGAVIFCKNSKSSPNPSSRFFVLRQHLLL